MVLHLVAFIPEKQKAHSSSVVVNFSETSSKPASIRSAWFFDWRTEQWTAIANDKIRLEVSPQKVAKGFAVSGTIEVPPMLFMGEPEGMIVLIQNPLGTQFTPEILAQSVNGLMKMKPVFR